MLVNFAQNGLPAMRIVVIVGITLAMAIGIGKAHAYVEFTTAHTGIEVTPKSGEPHDLKSKQVNILIRLIGHQLLLLSGDSSSRVLPVTEVNEGTFMLQVEKQLFFSHDSLIALSQRYLPKSRFPSGYTVTVHDCFTSSIVYGFQINNSTPDVLACQGRHEPAGCYSIEFTFTDLYKPVVQDQVTVKKQKSTKTQIARTDAKTESLEQADQSQLTQKLESMAVHGRNAKTQKPETRYPILNLVYTTFLISLGVTLVLARFRLFTKLGSQTKSEESKEDAISPFPSLGKFQFDVAGQRLFLGAEAISLTEKECRILEELNAHFGELVLRETLIENIWTNEGVITGRSLDMFVSKLRKKLSGDPDLRITNIHGKGYKLEVQKD